MLLSGDVLCQIMSMAENFEYQLLSCFHQNHNFLLQFVKSINIVGYANLLASVWYDCSGWNTWQFFVLLLSTNTGESIFRILNNFIISNEMDWETGSVLTLTAFCQWQAWWRGYLRVSSCIMAMCCNIYFEQVTVLKPIGLRRLRCKAVRTVRFITRLPLNVCILKALCVERESEHTKLLFPTEVLTCFFGLHMEDTIYLLDSDWIFDFVVAFLISHGLPVAILGCHFQHTEQTEPGHSGQSCQYL
jgi:hypothetical protein